MNDKIIPNNRNRITTQQMKTRVARLTELFILVRADIVPHTPHTTYGTVVIVMYCEKTTSNINATAAVSRKTGKYYQVQCTRYEIELSYHININIITTLYYIYNNNSTDLLKAGIRILYACERPSC